MHQHERRSQRPGHRLLHAVLILLACAVPSWAAVAQNGLCNAQSTACTFTATATGSLKVVFAFNNAATIPTVPGTYTTIDSATVNSGGSRISYAVGCNISSSSGDTGSGTWTNATSVVGTSYSGTAGGTTADCNTTGVGAFTHGNAAGSTSMNYPALTLQNGSGSWVIGDAGGGAGSGTITCTPTGMTVRGTPPTNARVSDTNGTVASWSSTSCTVSSENWVTWLGEAKAPATTVPNSNGLLLRGLGSLFISPAQAMELH